MSSTWNAGKEGLKTGRAQRYRSVREALDLTQEEFADLLNDAARVLSLEASYRSGDISPRENGRKELEVEDYVLASYLDPGKHSWSWFAFGRELSSRRAATAAMYSGEPAPAADKGAEEKPTPKKKPRPRKAG